MANLKDSIECIEKIKQDIRNLRDADYVKCLNHSNDKYPCICENFDLVNDKLDELSKDLNEIRDDLLHPAMQNINI